MNSRPDAQPPAVGAPSGSEGSQALLGEYLDHLCAPLLGVVPYAQRLRLRAEAEDHLFSLAEDFEAEGFTTAEAVVVALKEYGDPWRVGQEWADAWLCGASPSRLSRFADAVTLRAFGWFGVFTILNLLALEGYVLEPSQSGNLPMIEFLAAVSPIAAGALTGFGGAARTAPGICRALGLLALVSTVVGLLLRPHTEGMIFAAVQCMFWIPAGCLSAAVTAGLRRQLRIQHFRISKLTGD